MSDHHIAELICNCGCINGCQTKFEVVYALCESSSFLSNVFLVKVTTIVEYEDAKYTSAKKIPKKVSLLSINKVRV